MVSAQGDDRFAGDEPCGLKETEISSREKSNNNKKIYSECDVHQHRMPKLSSCFFSSFQYKVIEVAIDIGMEKGNSTNLASKACVFDKYLNNWPSETRKRMSNLMIDAIMNIRKKIRKKLKKYCTMLIAKDSNIKRMTEETKKMKMTIADLQKLEKETDKERNKCREIEIALKKSNKLNKKLNQEIEAITSKLEMLKKKVPPLASLKELQNCRSPNEELQTKLMDVSPREGHVSNCQSKEKEVMSKVNESVKLEVGKRGVEGSTEVSKAVNWEVQAKETLLREIKRLNKLLTDQYSEVKTRLLNRCTAPPGGGKSKIKKKLNEDAITKELLVYQEELIETLQKQTQNMEKELRKVWEVNRSLEDQVALLTEKVNLQVKQFEDTVPKSYVDKCRIEQQKLEEEIEVLQGKNLNLQKQALRMISKADVNHLQKDNVRLRKERSLLGKKMKKVSSEVEKLQDRLETQKSEHEKVLADLAKLLREANDVYEKEILSSSEVLRKKNAKNDERQDDMKMPEQYLNAQIKELVQTMDFLKKSRNKLSIQLLAEEMKTKQLTRREFDQPEQIEVEKLRKNCAYLESYRERNSKQVIMYRNQIDELTTRIDTNLKITDQLKIKLRQEKERNYKVKKSLEVVEKDAFAWKDKAEQETKEKVGIEVFYKSLIENKHKKLVSYSKLMDFQTMIIKQKKTMANLWKEHSTGKLSLSSRQHEARKGLKNLKVELEKLKKDITSWKSEASKSNNKKPELEDRIQMIWLENMETNKEVAELENKLERCEKGLLNDVKDVTISKKIDKRRPTRKKMKDDNFSRKVGKKKLNLQAVEIVESVLPSLPLAHPPELKAKPNSICAHTSNGMTTRREVQLELKETDDGESADEVFIDKIQPLGHCNKHAKLHNSFGQANLWDSPERLWSVAEELENKKPKSIESQVVDVALDHNRDNPGSKKRRRGIENNLASSEDGLTNVKRGIWHLQKMAKVDNKEPTQPVCINVDEVPAGDCEPTQTFNVDISQCNWTIDNELTLELVDTPTAGRRTRRKRYSRASKPGTISLDFRDESERDAFGDPPLSCRQSLLRVGRGQQKQRTCKELQNLGHTQVLPNKDSDTALPPIVPPTPGSVEPYFTAKKSIRSLRSKVSCLRKIDEQTEAPGSKTAEIKSKKRKRRNLRCKALPSPSKDDTHTEMNQELTSFGDPPMATRIIPSNQLKEVSLPRDNISEHSVESRMDGETNSSSPLLKLSNVIAQRRRCTLQSPNPDAECHTSDRKTYSPSSDSSISPQYEKRSRRISDDEKSWSPDDVFSPNSDDSGIEPILVLPPLRCEKRVLRKRTRRRGREISPI